MSRQYVTPVLIENGAAMPLTRVPFSEKLKSEEWLQELLFKHPQLLPIDEIEPVFSELLPVAQEVPTEGGPLDLLYVNADGYLTLVETKLWRNPEARRSVVAQIIDYAKDMSRWSYDDLVRAVKKVGAEGDDPLAALASRASEKFEEAVFVDAVSRNLRLGRFLLLIVGDGIQEGVEQMVDFLQQTPRLGFTLSLVELALYRKDPTAKEPFLVQPRVLTRTREVPRVVVEVNAQKEVDVRVSVSVEASNRQNGDGAGSREPMTEPEFFEELAARKAEPEVVEFAQEVVADAGKHRLRVRWRKKGLSLCYIGKNSSQTFSLGYFHRSGHCEFGWLHDQCEEADIDPAIGNDFFDEVAALIPNARREEKGVSCDEAGKLRSELPMLPLVKNKSQFWAAVDRAVARIREALEPKVA